MALWVRLLFTTADPAEVEPAAEAHRQHLRELRAAGRLRISGSLAAGDGFLDVFEAADRLEAEATLRESPLVDRGLVSWSLRPFAEDPADA